MSAFLRSEIAVFITLVYNSFSGSVIYVGRRVMEYVDIIKGRR